MTELQALTNDKLQWEWHSTACLLAMLHNVNCTKKDKTKEPHDFGGLKSAAKKKSGTFRQKLGAFCDSLRR